MKCHIKWMGFGGFIMFMIRCKSPWLRFILIPYEHTLNISSAMNFLTNTNSLVHFFVNLIIVDLKKIPLAHSHTRPLK